MSNFQFTDKEENKDQNLQRNNVLLQSSQKFQNKNDSLNNNINQSFFNFDLIKSEDLDLILADNSVDCFELAHKSFFDFSNLNQDGNFSNNSMKIKKLKKSKKLKKTKKFIDDERNTDGFNTGRWQEDEHNRFIEAIMKYGNEWKSVQKHVKTRSSTQARSHAQKFFFKIKRSNFLDKSIDFKKNSIQSLHEFANKLEENQFKSVVKKLNFMAFEDKKTNKSEKNMMKFSNDDSISFSRVSDEENSEELKENMSDMTSSSSFIRQKQVQSNMNDLKATQEVCKETNQKSSEAPKNKKYFIMKNYNEDLVEKEHISQISEYHIDFQGARKNSFQNGFNICFNNSNLFKYSDDDQEHFKLFGAENSNSVSLNHQKDVKTENEETNSGNNNIPCLGEQKLPKKIFKPFFSFKAELNKCIFNKNFNSQNNLNSVKPRQIFQTKRTPILNVQGKNNLIERNCIFMGKRKLKFVTTTNCVKKSKSTFEEPKPFATKRNK